MEGINWGNLLFGFRGRINRAKWWLTILIGMVIYVLALIVYHVAPESLVTGILALVAVIVLIWISLAAGAKRLHDLNRTAAWLVVFIGVPILLWIILVSYVAISLGTAIVSGGLENLDFSALAPVIGVIMVIGLINFAVFIWWLIWLGCLRGTVGPNQYGPDPLEGRV